MNRIDAQLRRYDAAPKAPLTPAESARAEDLLTRIIDTPRPETLVHRRVRRPLTLSLAGVAAAAAVAGAVVATQALGHGDSGARSQPGAHQETVVVTAAQLATWTPVPTHPATTSPAVKQAASACLQGAKGAADPRISDVDQRGDDLSLMATDPVSGQRWWCFGTPIGTLDRTFIDAPGHPLVGGPPAKGTVSVQQLLGSGGSGGRAGSFLIGQAFGQVGAGVTSVTLTTAAGEKITATVQDGLWSLWWPAGSFGSSTDQKILGETIDKATITWTTADGTSHAVSAKSILRDSVPIASDGIGAGYLPPASPGKSFVKIRPYTGPDIRAMTPAEACEPDATHPAATISNLVRSGASFELICTYPASGAQWSVAHASGDKGVSAEQINASGKPLPAIARNAVDLADLTEWASSASASDHTNYGWGRVGADVTSVTLITHAGEKVPAKVQNGFWTALWPSKSANDAQHMTLTWKTADGTTYTAAGDKVSGNNGLRSQEATN